MHTVSLDLSHLFFTPNIGICIAQAAVELCQKDSSVSGLFQYNESDCSLHLLSDHWVSQIDHRFSFSPNSDFCVYFFSFFVCFFVAYVFEDPLVFTGFHPNMRDMDTILLQ